MSDIKLTRQELYNRVWERPMTKVAPELGLSDVGLAKVCRKYDIPRPPVGYWAKLAHGKTIERVALPTLEDEDLDEIIAFREHFDRDVPEKQREKIVVEVPEKLNTPHELVRRTRASIKNEPIGQHGIVYGGEHCLNINVSRKSIPRALRIFDAAIKAWEKEGGEVTANPTVFRFGDDGLSVSLKESVRRYEKKNQTSRHWTNYGYELTGKLTLEIERYGDGLRKSWKDGKIQTVESVLGNFIASLHDWMTFLKGERLDNECEGRQRQKAEKRRASFKEKAELEQARRDELMSFVESWEKAERIRKYLSAIESAINSKTVTPPNPETFALWLEWAHWYAGTVCPISATRPRNESIEIPDNCPVQELDLTRATRKVVELLPYENSDELFHMDRKELDAICDDKAWWIWREIILVLEGLGYDVSKKDTGYW